MSRVTKTSFILLLIFVMQQGSTASTFPQVDLDLNGKLYRLEVADNDQRKTQGLMFRRYLAKNEGMIFVYDEPQALRIWMKNTFIPLTVIWLDEQARVIDLRTLFPCGRPNCPSFGPDQFSRYVIELNASEFSRFKVGDRLTSIKRWGGL